MFNMVGTVEVEILDKKTNKVIMSDIGHNYITMLWRERISAFLGGFGGVDADEIRPYEMIGYSNAYAAENGLTSLSSSVGNVSSSGLTGNVYFEDGNLDISLLTDGKILYKGDFFPGEENTSSAYIIRSFRLATTGGTTSIGSWTVDQYAPVAAIKVVDAFKNFTNGEIIVNPGQILVVRWTLQIF